MTPDQLIGRLSAELTPVQPRKPWRDGLMLGGLCIAELVIYLLTLGMRHDMPMPMHQMSFWWKGLSLALMAFTGGASALISLDPTRSSRAGLRWLAGLVVVSLAAGWVIGAAQHHHEGLAERLDWHGGMHCMTQMVLLALPPALLLGWLMRRGAPTDRTASALVAGLGAASWGAFVFVFACPYDDPLYIAVWYSAACALVTFAAVLLLPRAARW